MNAAAAISPVAGAEGAATAQRYSLGLTGTTPHAALTVGKKKNTTVEKTFQVDDQTFGVKSSKKLENWRNGKAQEIACEQPP